MDNGYIRIEKCDSPGRNIPPNYEYMNPLFCNTHKELDMITIDYRRCELPGCMTRSNFGYEGQSSQFCSVHRFEGMIDVNHKQYRSLTILVK